jgi:hypothetical protein
VVAAVRFLVTVLFLSGGGALRISVVRHQSSPSSAASGFVEFFVPHPDRERPFWLLMLLKVKMVMGFVKVTTALGAGPQGPLSGDFPAARGGFQSKRVVELRRIRRATGSSSPELTSFYRRTRL